MATRPKMIARDKLVRMQESLTASPIIDNPTRRAMSNAAPRPRKVEGKTLLMDSEPKPVTGGRGEKMNPVPAKGKPAASKPVEDQSGPLADRSELPASVRLRLRVEHGHVSVIGAHAVPGTMPVPERLDYGLAYEIANGNRRVAVGSIPDVGMRRSFPDPDGRTGMEGHHLTELESFEINVRIPQKELSERALPRLRVTLFRMKGQPPVETITEAPLAEQFSGQLRPVAELRGIDLRELPKTVQSELKAAASAKVVE